MTFRILNLIVIGALILAAAYVYRIKFDSTVQAERLAKIRGEVRRARDTIAELRAEWSQLDNPARIEGLAKALFASSSPSRRRSSIHSTNCRSDRRNSSSSIVPIRSAPRSRSWRSPIRPGVLASRSRAVADHLSPADESLPAANPDR